MQITHDEARRFIQFDMDHALKPHEKNALWLHLDACVECQIYAESIKRVDTALRPLLQRNWNKQPIPIAMSAITGKRNHFASEGAFLATRIAIIGVICMGFMFSVWQFTLSSQTTPDLTMVSAPPVPTPSTQSIHMTSTSDHCGGWIYIVKENDTVESIAQAASISSEHIMSANRLWTEQLQTGMQILIPACSSTPTGTVHALTTTYTPAIEPITSTPGG